MICPNCNSTLSKMHYKDVEVDFCKNCKGTWFDTDELNSVIEQLVENEQIPYDAIKLERDPVSQYQISEKERNCPHCGEKMSKLNYAYDSNIILDKCDSCKGIWVDNDEIMRLAVFRKGNPILNRMGEAIAEDRGKSLNSRYSDGSDYSTASWFGARFGLRIILPLSDDQERHSFPYVVVNIMLLNVAIFIFQILFFRGDGIRGFYNQFGLIPDTAFTSVKGSYSFLTSMFIHGGMWHLVGNMLFLWIFGDNIEDRFGHWKFILLYLGFGLAASMLHIMLDSNSHIPCIGASGAISGTMGAYMILYPNAKIKTYMWGAIVDIPSIFYLGGWLAFQIIFAWLDSNRIGGGGAWFAHIGGFAAGAAVAILLRYIETQKKHSSVYIETNIKKYDPKQI